MSAHRMGRADAVRAWLRRQKQPKSARQILDAVEPGGDITTMCGTLGSLVTGGYLARQGKGQGGVKFTFLTDASKYERREHKPRTPTPKARARPAKIVRERKPAATRTAIPPASTPAHVPPVATPRPNNFAASLGTSAESIKHLQSRQIAEDVAAYLANGGRIQQLGHGESSQPTRSYREEQTRLAHNNRLAKQRRAQP